MSAIFQCTCSAAFLTIDDFETHIAEEETLRAALVRSQASISAALERCRSHAIVDSSDALNVKGPSENGKTRHCPHGGCARVEAFSKRKELRTHFRMHVECDEVCQCCAFRFRLVSKFLRHLPDMSKMDSHQAAYAKERRAAMVKRIDDELYIAENKKRTLGVAEERGTSKRPKLSHGTPALPAFQHAVEPPAQIQDSLGDGDFGVAYMPHATLLTQVRTIEQDITPQLAESNEEPAAFQPMPNLTEYNAPVHNEINWLGWINQPET